LLVDDTADIGSDGGILGCAGHTHWNGVTALTVEHGYQAYADFADSFCLDAYQKEVEAQLIIGRDGPVARNLAHSRNHRVNVFDLRTGIRDAHIHVKSLKLGRVSGLDAAQCRDAVDFGTYVETDQARVFDADRTGDDKRVFTSGDG
jgi:hypothetical protein